MGVGQLIGKLFGGDAGKNETVLRAYGKLPIYAEYRRLDVSPGTPTVFSQWMDAGRLAWVRSPSKSATGSTRPSRLVIGLPGTKEAVVASVWDSRDSLGRAYPFAFFVVCPPEALGNDPLERWVSAAGIHRAFERLYAGLHSLGSGGDFYRFYQKHTILLRPEDLSERVRGLRDDATKIVTEPWFKAVSWDGEVAPPLWFAGLLRRAERWKTQPAALTDLAISFPLAQGFSYEAQVVLWLEWLAGLFKKIGKMPWLVVPTESERSAPALHLVVRDLLPDDYQLLTTDDRAYSYVEHLSSPPAANAGTAAIPASDTPTDSLLAWLKQHAP
jgi:hypothetical protein